MKQTMNTLYLLLLLTISSLHTADADTNNPFTPDSILKDLRTELAKVDQNPATYNKTRLSIVTQKVLILYGEKNVFLPHTGFSGVDPGSKKAQKLISTQRLIGKCMNQLYQEDALKSKD